jgi:hypothetical protein
LSFHCETVRKESVNCNCSLHSCPIIILAIRFNNTEAVNNVLRAGVIQKNAKCISAPLRVKESYGRWTVDFLEHGIRRMHCPTYVKCMVVMKLVVNHVPEHPSCPEDKHSLHNERF